MTEPETLRIRIAMLEGFTAIETHAGESWGYKYGEHEPIPRYELDRNAIIEAVLRLPQQKQREYAHTLVEMLRRSMIGNQWNDTDVLVLNTATAAEMSAAFAAIHEDKP